MHTDAIRYHIIVQSDQDPDYLEENIELFLNLLREEIVEMSEDQFSSHISSLLLQLNETLNTLPKKAARYWKHIDDGFYEFDRGEFISFSQLEAECVRGG